jgi:hypothetical protein
MSTKVDGPVIATVARSFSMRSLDAIQSHAVRTEASIAAPSPGPETETTARTFHSRARE